MKIILTPHKDFIDQAQLFVRDYKLIHAVLPVESNFNQLKPKKERTCRFCGKSSTHTKFAKVAHLIPEMLANRYLFSDFECDYCNHYFGKFESDLANYLGISRTLIRTKAKTKIPGFTSPDHSIKAKAGKISDHEAIFITRENILNNIIKTDNQSGKIEIRFKKNYFSPLNVYKSILKVVLSLLPGDVVENDYKLALNLLMGRNTKKFEGCFLSGYILPMQTSFSPHAYLFEKMDSKAKRHTHVLALYFQNYIFAFPIPLNKNDLFFYNEKPISINLYPPLFPQFMKSDNLTINRFGQNFSSEIKIRDAEDVIFLQINKTDLANSAYFNTKTGKIIQSEFNPNEIIKIIMLKNGNLINPNDLIK